MRALLVVLSLLSVAATAQTYRPESLYVNPAFLHGSARLVGLAGAYVAVAEGADGMPSNMASVAHRANDSRNGFELEPLLSVTALLKGERDVDNDGVADDADRTTLGALGLRLQIHKVGVGFIYRGVNTYYCLDAKCSQELEVDQANLSMGAGITVWRDQLILAAALTRSLGAVHAYVDTSGDGVADPSADQPSGLAVGTGVELDFLFRPQDKPFRIGGSFKSALSAQMSQTNLPPSAFFDRALYAGMINPAVLSLGVAWRFGEGAERYNLLSPWARREYDELSFEQAQKLELTPEEQTGRLLLTTQLDTVLPVDNAIGVAPLVRNAAAPIVGTAATFTPRIAVEHLTFIHRLRLRGGSYLEPSIFPGIGPRPHFTSGFDLYLFHLLADWTVKGSADLAAHYQAFGISVGFW